MVGRTGRGSYWGPLEVAAGTTPLPTRPALQGLGGMDGASEGLAIHSPTQLSVPCT